MMYARMYAIRNLVPNSINKDLSVYGPLSNFTLKDETNLVDPVILISGFSDTLFDGMNYVGLSTRQGFNDGFVKYYFITEMVSVANGIMELHLHIDVLESYKHIWSHYRFLMDRTPTENSNFYKYETPVPLPVNNILVKQKMDSPFSWNKSTYFLSVVGGDSNG